MHLDKRLMAKLISLLIKSLVFLVDTTAGLNVQNGQAAKTTERKRGH